MGTDLERAQLRNVQGIEKWRIQVGAQQVRALLKFLIDYLFSPVLYQIVSK